MKSVIVTFNEKTSMLTDMYDDADKKYSILYEPAKKGTTIGVMIVGNSTKSVFVIRPIAIFFFSHFFTFEYNDMAGPKIKAEVRTAASLTF
jgi:hypothetical protein